MSRRPNVGPLAGQAERRSRLRAERRAQALQKALAEHRAAMRLTVGGEPLPASERARIRKDVGVALHMATWFHAYPWRRTGL